MRRWAERPNHVWADEGAAAARTIEIPVRYDGADLESVAEQTGLTREEVIELHSGSPVPRLHGGFYAGVSLYGGGRRAPYACLAADDAARNRKRAQRRHDRRADGHLSAALTGGLVPARNGAEEPFTIRTAPNRFCSERAIRSPSPLPRARRRHHRSGSSCSRQLPTRLFSGVHEPGLLDLVVDEGRFLAGHCRAQPERSGRRAAGGPRQPVC